MIGFTGSSQYHLFQHQRISNLSPRCQESDIRHLLISNGVNDVHGTSLCPNTSLEDASLHATVTLASASVAKKVLGLNGKMLFDYEISVDREFMGLTVLAAPENSKVEYVLGTEYNGLAGC